MDDTGNDILELETRDWTESLDDVLELRGPDRVRALLQQVGEHAQRRGLDVPVFANTPYVNTISVDDQPDYPGDLEVEEHIQHLIRWNAMAMVAGGNQRNDGIGGHISTYASVATLFEVGLLHLFKGAGHATGGDHIWWQGHASPGLYARAFLEGRLTSTDLENFRLELRPEGGLPSYPHPWLMPDFWQFPTVSMGLGPIMAAYQARFIRYLRRRGIRDTLGAKVWAFLGDGEMDEPESTGVINFAARERLHNLVWVINCNLQRLDGPVRGSGKIVQELERLFRGAGWSVIKVLWGSGWDPLFAADEDGLLADRLTRLLDGEWQKCVVEGGAYMRQKIFGEDPRLLALVQHMSDEDLQNLRTGGHDPKKVHAAYRRAMDERERPTVILAQTIKGFGMGKAGEGMNIAHQQKKLDVEQLRAFRDRFGIDVPDADLEKYPFLRFEEDSREATYLRDSRHKLGGFMPSRRRASEKKLPAPGDDLIEEFLAGTDRPATTTAVFVRVLSKLLKDKDIGPRIVPIIPDEARTFGMDALFRQIGIHSSSEQLYEPVDSASLLYYKETRDGQLLEEGITEAGATSSFIAAGTSYSTMDEPMIPFYVFYSMFGFQRIGDLVWAGCDCRARGFLVGGTAGRTTLNGEGLQHEDGHSHVFASVYPSVKAYDPTYASEVALIVQDGLRRMLEKEEDLIYYLTVTNEAYAQMALPEGAREGVLKGLYRLQASSETRDRPRVQLLGSGAIMSGVLEARERLEQEYGVSADVWSVTSYTELRKDALDVERWNLLNPELDARVPYVTQCLGSDSGLVVAASDYVKALPDGIAKWVSVPVLSLGTDGYGRSETRAALRDFFEVDSRHVTWAALVGLHRQGHVTRETLVRAKGELGIDADKRNPMVD